MEATHSLKLRRKIPRTQPRGNQQLQPMTIMKKNLKSSSTKMMKKGKTKLQATAKGRRGFNSTKIAKMLMAVSKKMTRKRRITRTKTTISTRRKCLISLRDALLRLLTPYLRLESLLGRPFNPSSLEMK